MNMILLHGYESNKKIYLNADFIESIQTKGDKTWSPLSLTTAAFIRFEKPQKRSFR